LSACGIARSRKYIRPTKSTVAQRTSAVGVRMALGADRESLVRMVLGGAFLQVGVGLALGIPAAIAGGRLMSKQLFG
jgi:ABC-type antimicrobial peptide transport system permease subunit